MNPLHFELISLFPSLFEHFLSVGLWQKAVRRGLVGHRTIDLRWFGEGKSRRVDDTPYGGMAGMLLKTGPLEKAQDHAQKAHGKQKVFTILFSPRGRRLQQGDFASLRGKSPFCLVAAHYEGVDQRFIDDKVDLELSIGDYVIASGELACLVFMEGMARQIPGFMGNDSSLDDESFTGPFLEYDQYTKPREWNGRRVPSVLYGGNHAKIEKWRSENAAIKTYLSRPDVWSRIPYNEQPLEAVRGHIAKRNKMSLREQNLKNKV